MNTKSRILASSKKIIGFLHMKVDLGKVGKKCKAVWILLAVLGLIVNIILHTYIIDKFITIPLMIILTLGILFNSIATILQGIKK